MLSCLFVVVQAMVLDCQFFDPVFPFDNGVIGAVRPMRTGLSIGRMIPGLCRKLTPLGQRGSAIFFEGFAAVEMTVEIEMIVDRGMDGSKLLQGLHVPKFRHRAFSSPERLV